jgi:hypothetical protein
MPRTINLNYCFNIIQYEQFQEILLTTIIIFLLILLLLKLYDMFRYSILWNLKYGVKCSNEFHDNLESLEFEKAFDVLNKYNHDPMRLCHKISNFKPKWIFKNIANYIYRWPTLTILISFSIVISPFITLNILLSIAVLISIIMEYFHQIISRLAMGAIDNINKYAYIRITETPSPKNVNWHSSKILRDASVTLLIQLFVFTQSFAILYWFVYSIDKNHFSTLKEGSFLDFIYLSVVAVTSVGFGDYSPDILSKILILIQIILSWSFVLFMVFHYSASLSTTFKKLH